MSDEKPMSASTGAIKKKREDKSRKRDHRSWENVIKSLNNMTESEKLAVIQEKYTELHSELRKVTSSHQMLEKQCSILQRERDHTQTELTKHIVAKAKLEGLCRELQKQNKVIKDENITRVKEEEERRREVATNFTEKLNMLTNLMDENKDKSVRLREENMSMTAKLSELYDQFQDRENHLANVNRQMELQKKLSDTQIKKLEVEYQSERQVWDQERKMLLENLAKSDEANVTLQGNIKSLQEHLDLYKSQYSDFETTMQKSNKVFESFKEEIAKMQKANAQLEKERTEYRTRWQTCTNSVVQVSEMHQQTTNELRTAERKIATLERLCRQLQNDRSAYLQQLEENKITPVPSHPLPDEKPAEKAPTQGPSGLSAGAQRRLTKKEKLLVALKSELKSMEDELKKNITVKDKELTTLKRLLKHVVDQRKVVNKQASQESSTSLETQTTTDQTTGDQSTADQSTSDQTTSEMEKSSGAEAKSSTATECASLSTVGQTSSTDLDSYVTEIQSASSLGPKTVANVAGLKKVQSLPIMKPEDKPAEPHESSSSSSMDELTADLSLDAIPLYKPDGVTDLTVQPAEEALVAEVEGRTNLLVNMPKVESTTDVPETSSAELMAANNTETESTGMGTSQGTIPLKEVEGKTEFHEA